MRDPDRGCGRGETAIDSRAGSTPSAAELAPALVDRDLRWLKFNRRVLNEALDERTPLLERVKFLAIFSSNLDEFFMKRIALIRPVQGESPAAAEESKTVRGGFVPREFESLPLRYTEKPHEMAVSRVCV